MSIKTKLKTLSTIFIIIMAVSWVMNFGWLRLTFSLMLFPVIHAGFFYAANNTASKHFVDDRKVRILTVLNYATFLIPHLLVGDSNHCGKSDLDFFFGLITNSPISEIIGYIGLIILAINFVVIALQFNACKKSVKTHD